MPYSAEHKQKTRTRIINSARKLFNRGGFEGVSIGEIMADAGLTHGGFYKHFAGKDDLYEAAVLQFICLEQPEGWQRRYVDPRARGEALARMIIDSYLSDEHFADRDASCPMIGLPSDVSRGARGVRSSFRQVLEMMAGAFEGNLEPDARPARERSLAMVALVVGGMVLARAVDDPALASELRDSARKQAFEMSGWDWDKPRPVKRMRAAAESPA
jgi:AcrR family transcriptional regulator